jgi:hypothetical protein
MPASVRSFTLLLALPLLACGAHGKTGIPEGSDKPWAQMEHDERLGHMGAVVMPQLQAIFEGHDAERFSTFGCATCHGSGANDGSFAMPNPALPELDAANLYKKHRKESPDMVKLMWKKVEPAMGEALAVTYGFGGDISCSSCHIVINEKE